MTDGTLHEKLSKVQSKLKSIGKSGENTFFNNAKYALLEDVADYILPLLSDEGITVTHQTEFQGENVVLKTSLHNEGEEISSLWPVGKITDKQQALGSALTYGRRYTLMALTGVTAKNEDDDAEKAMGRSGAEKTQPDKAFNEGSKKAFAPPSELEKPKTSKERLFEVAGLKGLKPTQMKNILNIVCQKFNSKDLTEEESEKVIDYINKFHNY